MSKQKTSVKDWVLGVFGSTHKKISESLTAEEYNTFVSEAGQLKPRSDTSDEEEEAEEQKSEEQNGDGKTKQEEATKTLKMTEYDALNKAKADAEAKVVALEAEKKQLEQSETKLKAEVKQKEEYITKLKASLNPLGEKDLNNADDEAPVLTQADREARKAWEERQA